MTNSPGSAQRSGQPCSSRLGPVSGALDAPHSGELPAHPLPLVRAGPVGAWCPPSIALRSVSLPESHVALHSDGPSGSVLADEYLLPHSQ